MKNILLIAVLLMTVIGCSSGGGDPTANADPVPAGDTPGTTPRPVEPGKAPAQTQTSPLGTTGTTPGRT
jgi:hypothetical protein